MLKTTQEHTNTSYKTNRKKNLFIYHRYNLANVSNSSSIVDGSALVLIKNDFFLI
jgi:hypothetical protein